MIPPPIPEHAANHLFQVSMAALDSVLASAASTLIPVSEDMLEKLAADYARVIDSDTLDAAAREKGRAMIELLTSAAEFKRAARRYALAVIVQAAKP